MRNPNRPFVLVRKSPKDDQHFPQVVICDTRELVPAVINGYPTRVYKPVSEVMGYLDAYPKMTALNREANQESVSDSPVIVSGIEKA